MLGMTAIAVVRLHRLFGVVILFSIYSLLSASIFVALDAVDVAFTEAAVGAGISTVLMLATLVKTGRIEKRSGRHPLLPLVVVLITGAALIWGTQDLPGFGDPLNPVHQHVADRYIEQSPIEIGIPNMVTSVLASYRGYDTMGEVVVVFTALVGVLSLLGFSGSRGEKSTARGPNQPTPVLQVMAIPLVPFILLFALYVQFHGDFGPGGGFQAGVIFAVGIILYTLTFGLDEALALIPVSVVRIIAALGVLVYAGTGVVSMLSGGAFLDYSVLAKSATDGQHYGILIIELGVGLTVAAVMILIFFSFYDKAFRK